MIKRVIFKILSYSRIGKLIIELYYLEQKYLDPSGWSLSAIDKLPIDNNGEELPWFTYGAIHFLTPRLSSDHTVFEYGSGNSSMWLSKKVKEIISVEHDRNWYTQMKDKFEQQLNMKYLFKDLEPGDYHDQILKYDKEFDIIIIDGRNRVKCCLNSLAALKDGGVIIWDNSDRERYNEGYSFLISNGFRKLDFWGMGPINSYAWCTSIFYKDNNCLKI